MKTLYELQQEILAYLLNLPGDSNLSEQTQEDLDIYKSLILNNAEKFLATAFELCYSLLKPDWREIVKSYLENFPSSSPIYYMIGSSFYKYLDSEIFKTNFSYPNYLSELALFEWTKIELINSTDDKPQKTLNFSFPITEITLFLADPAISSEDKITTDIENDPETVLILREPENFQIKTYLKTR
jgi:hypothetical protein